VACQTCGLVQEVGDEVPTGKVIKCCRCNFEIFHRLPNSQKRTLALAIAAAILYFPANYYPIVWAEYQGNHVQTTIFEGIKSLFQQGQYFIGGLVFTTSMFTPALKIAGLIWISSTLHWKRMQKSRTWVFKIIRFVDPWNMLEVFMLAICTSMAELGEIATIHPGRGVFSFAAVVVLTLLATLSFDSRLLWDSPPKGKKYERENT
jgi:paraquat-inducible protein A